MKPDKSTLIGLLTFGTLLTTLVLLSGLSGLETPTHAGGCSPCQGPARTVTGHGTGGSCGEALNNAEADAYEKAWADAPGCTPCEVTDGPFGCALPLCVGDVECSTTASWTLTYKCKDCSLFSQ